MMRVCYCLTICGVWTAVTSVAAADDPPAVPSLEELDGDGDGQVSLAEFMGDRPEAERIDAHQRFHELDRGANGRLSPDELNAVETPEENAYVQKFRELDADANGGLSSAEYVEPAGEEFSAAATQEFGQYDADADESLRYEEFLLTPRAGLPPEARFSRLDGNGDGFVDRDEYLGQYAEPHRAAAREGYFNADHDGDLLLSRDEFFAPPEERVPHVRSRFALRDVDEDGLVSREEYVEPHIGGQWEEAARNESIVFDGNDDGDLTLVEFAFTPQPMDVRPILFELLDGDGDRFLTRDEYLSPHGAERRAGERVTFYSRDSDGDSRLSAEEFTAPPESWRPHLRSLYSSRDTDDDGWISRAEYFGPFIGGEWEQAAKDEAELFDEDQDGYLSLLEFALSPAGQAHPESLLELLDSDGDAALTVREFVEPRPAGQRAAMAAVFVRRDRNHDGRLVLEELQGQPDAAIVDPVSDLARGATAEAVAQWDNADRDGDGSLSEAEWGRVELESGSVLEFGRLDLNRDGKLTQSEFEVAVAAAYGLKRIVDGAPLRFSDGLVVNFAAIQRLDRNQDWAISRAEFIERFHEGPLNARRFSELDHDGNGVLNDAELLERRVFALDTLSDFCRIDQDFNGRLSPDEVVATAHPWQQRMCRQLVSAYDEDADGGLDLREYRLTPFANPMVEWYYGFRDADNDGLLSWREFVGGPAGGFLGLAHHTYEHIDADRDGMLSVREYPFDLDYQRVPLQAAFDALDRDEDGALTIRDATGLDRPVGNDPTLILRWEERMMQVEETFALADEDGDGRIVPQEFGNHRGNLAAALTGQAPPRAPLSLATVSSETETNWRLIGLIACNVLLLAGVGWYVLRGSAA